MASSLLNVCRFVPTAGGTADWTYSSAVTGYQGPAAAGAVNGATYSYRAESADLLQWEVGTGVYDSGTGVLTRVAVLFNSSGTTSKINFSAPPQVAVVALAEDLASLTAATMSDLLAGMANTWADSQLLFQLLFADSLIQNNTTDPSNDIDVLLDGSAVATKRLDAAWAAGTNQGGLDTGSKAINSTYHLYLLRKNADGTLDALFSASATAPTIPSGYTKVRVLGAVTTNSSGNIRAFQQFGDYFQLVVGVREASAVSVNPSATFITLTAVPHGVKVMARFFFDIANAGGSGGYGSCWDADLGIGADVSGAKLAVLIHTTGLTETGGQVTCPTSAAGQIAVYDSASGSTVTISTQGWYDPRVRRHAI